MDKKTIYMAVLATIVVIVALFLITEKSLAPKSGQKIPGQNQGQNNNSSKCVVENCHGLDIQCGANPPDVCTQIYQLGDRCLQYVKCGMVAGHCQQISDPQFDACKSCVQACSASFQSDPIESYNCESKCPTDKNSSTSATQ